METFVALSKRSLNFSPQKLQYLSTSLILLLYKIFIQVKKVNLVLDLDYRGLNIVKEDIKNMKYRFDEKTCLSLIENKKDKYKKLFTVLLDEDLTKKSKHYGWFKKVQEKYL